MHFGLNILDFSKLDKIKEALTYLSPNIDLTVLNNFHVTDVLLIDDNDNDITISSYDTKTIKEKYEISHSYKIISDYEFLYYTYLLKNKIDFIIKIDIYDDYEKITKLNYKIHHYYAQDDDFIIVINNDMHFIRWIIYKIFFDIKQPIDLNTFIRIVKMNQITKTL